MFHARLPITNTYTSCQALVFQTTLVNEGGCYNSNTGHFVASVSGVYMFTMQYCTETDKWARFDIVKEGTPLQRSVDNGIGGARCFSMQAFAKVSMGEKVWVRSTYSTSEVYQSDPNSNSFAGMLINNLVI
ncbi:hypothetical protein DPMN_133619 [Dreissena polymorpha]|uniref:C1q domain-containing protein n=1 Tax=Dreissena polymorpha TaxID=45954 RepID=A0A9D4FXD1_DREPO|nr:hypothetical protein DPMN_133619 [Dreissena polymorpha]